MSVTAWLAVDVRCPGCNSLMSRVSDDELGQALECRNMFRDCSHKGVRYGAPTIELLTKEEAMLAYRVV